MQEQRRKEVIRLRLTNTIFFYHHMLDKRIGESERMFFESTSANSGECGEQIRSPRSACFIRGRSWRESPTIHRGEERWLLLWNAWILSLEIGVGCFGFRVSRCIWSSKNSIPQIDFDGSVSGAQISSTRYWNELLITQICPCWDWRVLIQLKSISRLRTPRWIPTLCEWFVQ